tara:strand:- start:29027 stop:29368 length:342 start_codon:yes stop_codon:yes gene_type:complete
LSHNAPSFGKLLDKVKIRTRLNYPAQLYIRALKSGSQYHLQSLRLDIFLFLQDLNESGFLLFLNISIRAGDHDENNEWSANQRFPLAPREWQHSVFRIEAILNALAHYRLTNG